MARREEGTRRKRGEDTRGEGKGGANEQGGKGGRNSEEVRGRELLRIMERQDCETAERRGQGMIYEYTVHRYDPRRVCEEILKTNYCGSDADFYKYL